MPRRPIPLETRARWEPRFWRNVIEGDGCWEWQAGRMRQGYGVFGVSGGTFAAHRVAYALAHGVDPVESDVLHSCDNMACICPGHLHLGDQKANAREAVDRGRVKRGSGIRVKSDGRGRLYIVLNLRNALVAHLGVEAGEYVEMVDTPDGIMIRKA